MKHMTEQELIAFREGVVEQRAAISEHLAACNECREELERIEVVLAALDTLPVPDPGADYGRRVWQQIASRLPERPEAWWRVWFQPRRLAVIGALAIWRIALKAGANFLFERPPAFWIAPKKPRARLQAAE